jgi:hypothetical protein
MSCCGSDNVPPENSAKSEPANANDVVCCGPDYECESTLHAGDLDGTSRPWITGILTTAAGTVPVVATRPKRSDRLGTWKVRWGFGRSDYAIPPGLYAIGAPDAQAPVLVTANFKISFDRVRWAMDGRSAWLLVLDTKGINVWCAAGKGNFGTDELVRRIEATRLGEIVFHRQLVLPQLGAPGVAAHLVTKSTKFHVEFGPVRAEDLPAYLAAGRKTTPEMRLVRFPFRDRLILTPIELTSVFRHWAGLAFLGLWALKLLGLRFIPLDGGAVLGAIIIGTVAVPVLLPWIPGRAFAAKGWILGAVWAIAVCTLRGLPVASLGGWLTALSYVLILPAVSAFLAMTFTGSSTFTSLSGVVKEMKYSVPAMIASGGLGIAALVAGSLV